ncbi:glycosyltransferase family 2 protein [Mangrovibacterium sp.]|uniref:glycosyltransferase family 2 protein n=1 Tax=Mangrovibacterium sp. TaxID=1961364 RepID=UPI00356AC396
MKLSVIIVNYNVKHFLEQCLYSVEKALTAIDGEIIVVDNNSVDGSCRMLRQKFPSIHLIENSENTGFSKANNQAIRIARGEYVLLLNPDTLVEADCFSKCLSFMDDRPDAGAMGVKMIDGNGRYLPESKRGLPTPWVAFCKIFGLTSLFPKSKKFAYYYLGHLSADSIQEVEVLAGAFMFMRQSALKKSGLLDETFFMYGEDIDLSYRISQSGFRNFYFPETTIIHYKGESTKKGSLNYVKLFYNAMLIFSEKHFSNRHNKLFNLAIKLAIYFKAFLSVFNNLSRVLLYPLIDALLIMLGFSVLIPFWEHIQFEPGHFPPLFTQYIVPGYVLIWLICIGLSKGYTNPVSLKRLIRGILAGTIVISLVYSFLDESWRFSRALIFLTFGWTLLTLTITRILLSKTGRANFRLQETQAKRIILMAGTVEADRIRKLLQLSQSHIELIGLISPNDQLPDGQYLGRNNQIREVIDIHKPDELIFSGKDVPSGQIIDYMLDLNGRNLAFKIAPQESFTIIGSNSPNSNSELYQLKASPLSTRMNRILKRWLDVKVACVLLFLYPLLFSTFKNRRGLRQNCVDIIRGHKTWVGYGCPAESDPHLPTLKPGVLSPSSPFEPSFDEAKKLENDRLYAKNYRLLNDLELIVRNWKNLGR